MEFVKIIAELLICLRPLLFAGAILGGLTGVVLFYLSLLEIYYFFLSPEDNNGETWEPFKINGINKWRKKEN